MEDSADDTAINRAADKKRSKLLSKEISGSRVLVALIVVIFLGCMVWFGTDVVAEMSARGLVTRIQQWTSNAKISSKELHQAIGRRPTHSASLANDEYEERYIFDGIHYTYTVRVRYVNFWGPTMIEYTLERAIR